MKANGGFITREDLTTYKTVEREPIRADYRGWEILGPPPPAASGVHIAQMLNILEGYDIAGLGFGTAETIHYLAEVLKIAFADRAAASGDPDFIDVPVERLTSKAYADERRRAIDPNRAQKLERGRAAARKRAHHAHDGGGCAGQRGRDHADHQQSVRREDPDPGLGTVPNNYMNLYDPRPGHALSLAPGKRVTTSMSPMMALRDGKLRLRARPARRKADLSERDAGADQSDRPRHEPAGSGRGAADLDRRQCARGRKAVPESVRAKLSAMGHDGAGGADGRRRHERDPVPRGRQDVGCRLLARGRHADRSSPAGSRARA